MGQLRTEAALPVIRKKGLIQKELLFTPPDETIKTVHVGFFPPRGRYFREEMLWREEGYFRLEAWLPAGISYYHFFFNREFDRPRNHTQFVISPHDPLKRAPLILKTAPFCPVEFLNEAAYISHIKEDIWEVRVVTHQGWIEQVALVTSATEFPLSVAFGHKNTVFWTTRIHCSARLDYCIRICGPNQVKFLHRGYQIETRPVTSRFFTLYPESEMENTLAGSFRSGYQVLPDRFSRSNGAASLPGCKDWGEEPDHHSYFGGSLKGLRQKLDYIAGLGVEFIYLNPVFQAGSYHRYDCGNYLCIDPLLGTGEDFKELVAEAHRRGIKIILDISLNHCGTGFFAFEDILLRQQQSPFLDWFEIHGFPLMPDLGDQYSCWHGYPELPQFNLANEEVIAYFMRVARYWPEVYNIDGWRLDVCTEMPPEFIKKFTDESRRAKPDLVIIAESWQNDCQDLVSGCGVDGITDYTLYMNAILPFFVQKNISCSGLAANILRSQMGSGFRARRFSWNFLGNHDLPRFYSLLKNKRNYIPAILLLFSLPGTPVVYYGEEIGLEGLADPANRKCMPSGAISENNDIIGVIRQLNAIRAAEADIFDSGSLSFPFVSDEHTIVEVKRSTGLESIHFILNMGDCPYDYLVGQGDVRILYPHSEAGRPGQSLQVNTSDAVILHILNL